MQSTADNWWRGPRSSGDFETRGETIWPELSSPSKKRPGKRRPRNNAPGGCAADGEVLKRIVAGRPEGVDRSSILDDEGYPKLGQKLAKRRFPICENPLAQGSSQDVADQDKSNITKHKDNEEFDNALRKFSKRSRRSALICIELEKVLERQRSLSESQTSSTTRPARIELNLNLSIRNPLDSAQIIQCRKGKLDREIPREKRISKLKKVIFREREFKRQTNIWKRERFDLERIKAMTKEFSDIDFNRLKISGGSEAKPEVKMVRNLSSLSLRDNECRKSGSCDNFTAYTDADIVGGKSAEVVTCKLKNLLLTSADRKSEDDIASPKSIDTDQWGNIDYILSAAGDDNECEYFDDSDILRKTFSLKICDETGETVKEFEELKISPSANDNDDENVDTECRTESRTKTSIAPNYSRHSKNFREYCTNDLSPGLIKASENFLAEIYRLQRRMYERDEVKGRFKRRFYAGFKEVLKHVESKKIKFVFIAPDLEGIRGYPGGLDECVSKLTAASKIQEVVICFSLNKRKLGYYTHKKGSVSCVGIANYGGLEEIFKDLLTELVLAKISFARSSPSGPGETLNPSSNPDWNETLLSTKINLLLKSLQTLNPTPCS